MRPFEDKYILLSIGQQVQSVIVLTKEKLRDYCKNTVK